MRAGANLHMYICLQGFEQFASRLFAYDRTWLELAGGVGGCARARCLSALVAVLLLVQEGN